MIDLTAKYVDRLPNDTINKIQKASYRAVDLIELFFPNPEDYSKKVKLGRYQKDFIDVIQYGFPLSQFKFNEVTEPPDGVITIWRRQVGKSWSTGYANSALMILGPTSIGHPPTRCGIVAASEEESQLLIEKVKICFEESDFNEFIEGKIKLDKIKLKNGSFCKSHTCSPKSIRGPSYHYCTIDEGAQMDESILFSAAIPTTTHGERWVIITTPQGSKQKIIDYYIKGVETRPIICKGCGNQYTQKHFHEVEFPSKNRIWEMPKLPDCSCGVNSYKYGIGIWGTPWLDPWKTTIIDQKKLKRSLDAHSWSPWVRQELLGEIIDEASMVILNEWIQQNIVNSLRNTMTRKKGVKYVLGMDYGRLHDASSFCITHRDRKTKRIVLDYLRTVAGEYDFDTDYDKIYGHLNEIISFYQPVWVVPDSTGSGYSQVERLQKDIKYMSRFSRIYNIQKNQKRLPREKRRLGYYITKQTKPELIGNLITLLSLQPPALMLPPKTEPEIDKLATEMLRFECEVMDGGYIKYGTQNYHDDRLIAFALSLVPHATKELAVGKSKGFTYNEFQKKQRYNTNRKIVAFEVF